ncbi:site-specific integrase [Paraburkholderia bengalensis]|uniref:Site-specific integrase n=1 Tax=Paraburkholderia bengalensis TaxID=2747562 RepID=A0ABU8IL73_9BURK
MHSALEALPQTNEREIAEYERLHFLSAFLYWLALRVREIEGHKLDDFVRVEGVLWWRPEDTTFPDGHMKVPAEMEAAFARYTAHLSSRRVKLDRSVGQLPVLQSTLNFQPIGARRLHQILKSLFAQAAGRLPPGASLAREQLMHASAHWLRHTGIKAVASSGVSASETQGFARHAKFESTAPYLASESEEQAHQRVQTRKLPAGWLPD